MGLQLSGTQARWRRWTRLVKSCAGGRHSAPGLYPRPLQVNLWPFDLLTIESGVRVTYVCGLPLCQF